MTTPHISAAPGDFAELVLFPGDPLRARHLATRLLTHATEVTNVRNMLGYTGEWRGRRVSVMGSGMGIPSCVVYATELYREYGVRRIVRTGTCGALREDVALGEFLVATAAGTDSQVPCLLAGGARREPEASAELLSAVTGTAATRGIALRAGRIFSSDLFYHPDPGVNAGHARAGYLAIDMETAGLYALATMLGREALSVLAVSDQTLRGERWTPAQRESGLDDLAGLVLDAVTGAPSPA